jgi:hypothetical protein
MPEPGPLGETFLEAKARAIVAASFVKSPFCGCVESVCTLATQRFPACLPGALPGFVDLFLPRLCMARRELIHFSSDVRTSLTAFPLNKPGNLLKVVDEGLHLSMPGFIVLCP